MSTQESEPSRIISNYASSIIRGMLDVAGSLKGLEHNASKGMLREFLVSGVMRRFLAMQYSLSSGVIINGARQQSKQTDIIIFDNQVLPPFIYEQNVGVVPAESVLAAVEVKSWMEEAELVKAEGDAKLLKDTICKGIEPSPLVGVFGFYSNGLSQLRSSIDGKKWLEVNAGHLDGVVLAGDYSWLRVQGEWRPCLVSALDNGQHEEIKRFIAVFLDNCRTRSEQRRANVAGHKDWLSAYIRDQSQSSPSGVQVALTASSQMVPVSGIGSVPRDPPDRNEGTFTASSYISPRKDESSSK